ncbi:retropepsin-like aspartic protease [Sphingobacterium paucimobilis]|uniref:Peptidase A2 domain-containing protein n=1 Tax=Sphingobacterium paucimobilis HER1398 TaxID=1346330 RepID=U2J5C4_9SPHI|nr:retropepsin-like aspartic protease [Sphingobacterium paucimobilis]ERJ60124.1 hypothetical protein M472_15270 [Sphingobacterium paucimobilis HER1398]
MQSGKTKLIILAAAVLFGSNVVKAQSKEKLQFSAAINKSLQTQDTSGLSTYLADEFAVAGHTAEGAKFRLHQVIKNYGALSMQILRHESTSKGILYNVEFTEKDGNKTVSQVLVNTKGQLLYLTQFDLLYGLKREVKSRLVARIPFENHNGSIVLKVRINGFERPLNLLFDTGADGMALSQSLADEIGLKITRENNASVVGGNKTIQVSDNNTVSLDTLSLKGMGIAIFPEMGRDHAEGIIGNALIRRYITHIDYDSNMLSLYSFGPHTYEGTGQTVQVGMPSGIMMLPGELEIVQGKKYAGNFVFDTGASYDLICFRPFVRQNKLLVSGFKPEVQAATVSMGISSPTFLGKSYGFNIAGLSPMSGLPVTLMGGSSDNENWNPGADGSIGVRLLSRYNMTINLAEGEVFFSPNKLHSMPQDFVLKNYQLGWDNDGKLVVLGTAGFGEAKAELAKGAKIKSLGSYPADKLAKKAELIAEIQQKTVAGEEVTVEIEDGSITNL